MMFAFVSGASSAVRMASDQASWLVPVGVTFSAIAAGTRPEAEVVGFGAAVGLVEALGLEVALAVDGVAVGVADGLGVALPECDGFGVSDAEAALTFATWGAKVVITALDWLSWVWVPGEASVALVVLAVSGIGMAPAPTATVTPTRAAANPTAAMMRSDAGGRTARSLARTRS
jgi:hypothetical protein